MTQTSRKYPLYKFQIWIGKYDLGQGYAEPIEPKMVAEIEAPNFRVACVLYELRSSLKTVEDNIANDKYVDYQSCRWFYNFETNSNSWTGKYFENKEEAQKTFNKS